MCFLRTDLSVLVPAISSFDDYPFCVRHFPNKEQIIQNKMVFILKKDGQQLSISRELC